MAMIILIRVDKTI